MNDPGIRPECEVLLNELEELGVDRLTEGEVSSALTGTSRQHAVRCEECRAAIEDFLATREGLLPARELVLEPGPWFVARVMAAVKSTENEIEEKKEGVWISVRRFAPRLAAFAGLLLVLGGTWAMEVHRREAALQVPQMRQAEGLFETVPSAAASDEVVATAGEEARP
ncbi:MAG TPA: hypothetical protein VMJ35_03465 [Dongiaceae bacterium]|nr:hypothetical protein [Dongiaceae bacterium]